MEFRHKRSDDKIIEGYNPKMYRTLSVMFIILTALNIVAVTFAFMKTGYGLWHAETALSYIARIDGNFNDINSCVLETELSPDDQMLMLENANRINTYYRSVLDNAEKFRGIDMSGIDPALANDFDDVMSKIDDYYNNLSICIDNVKAGTADVSSFRNIDLEEMRVDAISSLRDLFDRSDKATYDFFFAVAKKFLFVLLFLFITMFAGLITISRSKKRDRTFALQVQASRMKIESAKQKVRDVVYSDILTGFKNRHALFEMLDEKMKTDNVSLVVYHFNDFRKIYADHGRDCGDEYISSISQMFEEKFGTQAEMYCIGESEFCAVFDPEILRGQISVIAQKMMTALSESISVSDIQISCSVSGCLCHCHSKQYASSADLFKVVDTNISQLKQKCAESGMSQLVQI